MFQQKPQYYYSTKLTSFDLRRFMGEILNIASPSPGFPIEASIMDSFGQMFGLYC